MSIERRVTISLLSACVVLRGVLSAGLSGPVPIGLVERQADIIAVATLDSVSAAATPLVNARLQITRVIKGQSVPSFLIAELSLSPMMAAGASPLQDKIPKRLIGTVGLWFLKEDRGNYRVLPLGAGDFTWDEVFLRLSTADLPAPASVIPDLSASGNPTSQTVLAALMNSYISSPDPSGTLRDIVLVSLDRRMARLDGEEDRQLAISAANMLTGSKSMEHQIVGLVSAIRLGSDSVFSTLAQKAAALQSHRMFPFIASTLQTDYVPSGEFSIAPLRQLVGLHLEGANFDAAVAAALQKIGTKAVLPAMVGLLDSEDPQAKLRAARFLSDYALFADANGSIPVLAPGEGRTVGPWATDATRLYTPGRQPTVTTEEYVSFWKSWWAENRVKLGFTGS